MRKKSINPKARTKLLDAAEGLMLKKGYAATSIDDICRKAGLTKGSLFHYFQGKEDLGKAVLERFASSAGEKIKACCCPKKQGGDPLKRIYKYIDYVIEMSKEDSKSKGCLIGAFSQELADTHPKIRSSCAQGIDQWTEIIKTDLTEAKRRHAIKKDVNPQSLAEYFIAVFEGSQILARAKQDSGIIADNMKHLKSYIQKLFENK